jgi:hypothetical protein
MEAVHTDIDLTTFENTRVKEAKLHIDFVKRGVLPPYSKDLLLSKYDNQYHCQTIEGNEPREWWLVCLSLGIKEYPVDPIGYINLEEFVCKCDEKCWGPDTTSKALPTSMKENGQLLPIIIRYEDGKFAEYAELGNQRILVALALGWKKISAYVCSKGHMDIDGKRIGMEESIEMFKGEAEAKHFVETFWKEHKEKT